MKIELNLEPEQISECTTILDQLLDMELNNLKLIMDIDENRFTSIGELFTQLIKIELT